MSFRTVSRITTLTSLFAAYALAASAAPVYWTDWKSGTVGTFGSATGVITTDDGIIDVTFEGQIAFIQTSGGTNYWNPSAPYISAQVDNAPGTTDIIAMSQKWQKTLTFSKPVDNLFFALVSLNDNGYIFNRPFEVVSYGHGFWGNGTLTATNLGIDYWMTTGTGEPHGVIRFTEAVSSISWVSDKAENWNGFTVGTYGIAPVPDHASTAMLLGGALCAAGAFRRRRLRR